MKISTNRTGHFPGYYVIVGFAGAVAYWLFEAFIHHYIFAGPIIPGREGHTLADDVYPMEPDELWMRGLTSLLFILIGVYADVVARRQTAIGARLSESREMYRAFVESARDSVFILDRACTVRYVNGHGADFLGSTPEGVTGRRIDDLFGPESVRHMRENVEGVFSSGRPKVESSLFVAHGRECWLDTSLAPIYGADGEVAEVLGVSRDITGMKEYESHLRAERDRANLYLDVAGVMIIALDHAGRVSLINRKGAEILGLSEEEVLGRDWFSDFLPEGVGKEARVVFESIISGDASSYEYHENVIVARDGTEKLIAWRNAVLTDPDGRVTGTLSSGTDITEQRRLDNALAERLEELERFREVTVKRELRIKELKDRVRELEADLGIETEMGV